MNDQDAAAAKQRAIEDGLKKAIAGKKAQDPLIGMKMGAEEMNQNLIRMLKDDKGVHIESFLAILGSLAGFSCQMSLRGGDPKARPASPIAEIKGKNGRTYYAGDALNAPLVEGPLSIWALAAGGAQTAGCLDFPDLPELFKHVAATLGGDQFGLPRYPAGHDASWDTPEGWVRVAWPKLSPMLPVFCDKASEWPVLFALAAHNAILMGKDALDPALGLRIIMETAVPMSKVEPMEVLAEVK